MEQKAEEEIFDVGAEEREEEAMKASQTLLKR